MTIFDAFTRSDTSTKRNIETEFDFMNRSARPEIGAARDLLESLVAQHPDKDELKARFRSRNNTHFRSAMFELLLFSALQREGFTLQPHPTPPKTDARPDYLVTSPSGDMFYLEAVLASEDTGDPTDTPLLATTLDVFTTTAHENFGVIVRPTGAPTTQPSQRKLRNETLAWLDSLDPEEVQATINQHGYHRAPTMTWSHERLTIELQAIPLTEERRGKASQLLIALFGQASWVNSSTPLRRAIAYKGRKYGYLDAPLVIAVNIDNRHSDEEDEMQALFGDEQIAFSTTQPETPARLVRARNGAWTGATGPKLTRVSAAWIFNNLSIYSLPGAAGTLYCHPSPDHPVPPDLLRFRHATWENETARVKERISFGSVFNLPSSWPRVE